MNENLILFEGGLSINMIELFIYLGGPSVETYQNSVIIYSFFALILSIFAVLIIISEVFYDNKKNNMLLKNNRV